MMFALGFLIGVVIGFLLLVVLGLCRAAARGDALYERERIMEEVIRRAGQRRVS